MILPPRTMHRERDSPMPDSENTIELGGTVAMVVNPPEQEFVSPEVSGMSAKASIDRDGKVKVTITGFARYADREVSVIREIDNADTQIDELLKALVAEYTPKMQRRLIRAAVQAMNVAGINGELGDDFFEEDDDE